MQQWQWQPRSIAPACRAACPLVPRASSLLAERTAAADSADVTAAAASASKTRCIPHTWTPVLSLSVSVDGESEWYTSRNRMDMELGLHCLLLSKYPYM